MLHHGQSTDVHWHLQLTQDPHRSATSEQQCPLTHPAPQTAEWDGSHAYSVAQRRSRGAAACMCRSIYQCSPCNMAQEHCRHCCRLGESPHLKALAAAKEGQAVSPCVLCVAELCTVRARRLCHGSSSPAGNASLALSGVPNGQAAAVFQQKCFRHCLITDLESKKACPFTAWLRRKKRCRGLPSADT